MTRRNIRSFGAYTNRREGLRGRPGKAATGTKQTSQKRVSRAGRPTQDELERRKQGIMRVATALFARHGYASTSLADIARGAGVATRTLYHHFGGKELIFDDMMFARETAAVFPPARSSRR